MRLGNRVFSAPAATAPGHPRLAKWVTEADDVSGPPGGRRHRVLLPGRRRRPVRLRVGDVLPRRTSDDLRCARVTMNLTRRGSTGRHAATRMNSVRAIAAASLLAAWSLSACDRSAGIDSAVERDAARARAASAARLAQSAATLDAADCGGSCASSLPSAPAAPSVDFSRARNRTLTDHDVKSYIDRRIPEPVRRRVFEELKAQRPALRRNISYTDGRVSVANAWEDYQAGVTSVRITVLGPHKYMNAYGEISTSTQNLVPLELEPRPVRVH